MGFSQQVLDYNLLEDPIQNIICHFEHQPRIIAINDKVFKNLFKFKCFETDGVTSELKKLDLKKTTTEKSIVMLK